MNIHSLFLRAAIWLSGCYKTRISMILTLILPLTLLNVVFLVFWTMRESRFGLNEARAVITATVVEEATYVREYMRDVTGKLNRVAACTNRDEKITPFASEVLKNDPALDAIAICYAPSFLEKLARGEYPEFKLENDAYNKDRAKSPKYYCRMFLREGDEIVHVDDTSERYTCEAWYHLATLFRTGKWSGPAYGTRTRSLVCQYSIPLYYGNEFAGIACIGIRIDEMFEKLHSRASVYFDRIGMTYMIGDNGRLLYSSRPELQGNNIYAYVPPERDRRVRSYALLDAMQAHTTGSFMYENSVFAERNDVTCFVYTPVSNDSDWALVRTFSRSKVMATVYARIWRTWTCYLVVFLITTLLVVMLALNVYRPIQAVSELSQKFAEGAQNVTVPENYERLRNPMGKLAANFNYMVRELRRHVATEVEEKSKNQAIQHELETAREIQLALLPDSGGLDDSRIELASCYLPEHYVAGDFYDFWKVDNDRLFFLVADVTGKGVPAGIVMSSAKALICMATVWEREPGKILALANNAIIPTNRDRKFVTVFLGLYNLRTGELFYSNGGHPSPLLVSEKETRFVSDNCNFVVGVFPNVDFRTSSLVMEPGQTLLLYTDGVTESAAKNKEQYGEQRLCELCQANAAAGPAVMVEKIRDAVDEHGQGKQNDDITILAFRRNMLK